MYWIEVRSYVGYDPLSHPEFKDYVAVLEKPDDWEPPRNRTVDDVSTYWEGPFESEDYAQDAAYYAMEESDWGKRNYTESDFQVSGDQDEVVSWTPIVDFYSSWFEFTQYDDEHNYEGFLQMCLDGYVTFSDLEALASGKARVSDLCLALRVFHDDLDDFQGGQGDNGMWFIDGSAIDYMQNLADACLDDWENDDLEVRFEEGGLALVGYGNDYFVVDPEYIQMFNNDFTPEGYEKWFRDATEAVRGSRVPLEWLKDYYVLNVVEGKAT